jgi:6-pyruvoyltetrahydropterin/6-carboxytetrahydropterin synthase
MPKWTLTTEFTFNAAHWIRDYDGPCGRMHGHTYTVKISAIASQLHTSEFSRHGCRLQNIEMGEKRCSQRWT